MRYVEEMESGLIVHLSASTYLSRDTLSKKVITSVEKTIELGADWVNIHINVGSKNDIEQIKEVLRVAEIFDSYGIPLLVMSVANKLGTDTILVAGGVKRSDFLKVVEKVMRAGAFGIVAGRNIFQSEDLKSLGLKIQKIIHGGVEYERDLVNR